MSASTPADSAAVLAEAERIEAIASKLAAEPGNYGTYMIIKDPKLWKQAEQVLGHSIWERTNAKDPGDMTRLISEMYDYRDAIHGLRAKANELRGSVRPEKPYPWLTCAWCDRITGWLDFNHCDQCEAGSVAQMNFHKLPEAWIGSIHDYDDVLEEGLKPTRFLEPKIKTKMPWRMRLFSSPRRRDEWRRLAFAEPFEYCDARPLAAEKHYLVWLPIKGEKESTTGGVQLLLFGLRAYRWGGTAWQEDEKARAPRLDFPCEFAATLPMETLAVAWEDFTAEVDALNAQLYRESHVAEAKQQADELNLRLLEQDRRDEVERGKGVLDALEQGSGR